MKTIGNLTEKLLQSTGKQEKSSMTSLPATLLDTIPSETKDWIKRNESTLVQCSSMKARYGSKFNENRGTWEFDVVGEELPSIVVSNLPEGTKAEIMKAASGAVIIGLLTSLTIIKKSTRPEAEMMFIMQELASDFSGIPVVAVQLAFESLKREPSPWFPDYHVIVERFNDFTKRVGMIKDAYSLQEKIA
jgi:hypothetical protein